MILEMTSKKYLSNKKNAVQTISLSPALKEWVERYVRVNRKKHPKDARFKSVSSFYAHVMEILLRTFQNGKSLDDLEKFLINETKNKK